MGICFGTGAAFSGPLRQTTYNAHKITGTLMMIPAEAPPASDIESQLKKAWNNITKRRLPLVLLYNQVKTIVAKVIETRNIGKPRKPIWT